jgi:exopolysaccharide production protein ExoY
MSEPFMAEMPPLMPEIPSQGSGGSFNELFAAVRGDAPGRGVSGTGVASAQRPLGGPVKRCIDLMVAGASLLVLMPVVLMIAALILLTMGRPVLFAHPRVGFQRRLFPCLKFRSMVRNPDEVLERYLAGSPEAAREWNESQKLRHDPRVTFVGRMLRKSSLDELPQLISVLRGEMSCVGPRPVVADELDRYGVKAPLYLSTRPGMTGLWQVSGRSSVDYAQRVALDETYVRTWSVWLDLRILLSTVLVVLKFDQAA